jgi:acyl-CoA dehydrogenase
MGRVLGSEVFNCSAPDTGNMETIARYGTSPARQRWLKPLLEGKIRSAFAMTEPDVASSDATNIETRIERQGDEYVINGRKWWTRAPATALRSLHHHGQDRPEAPQALAAEHDLVPADTPGVKIVRPLNVFGYDDAPHGHAEVLFRERARARLQHPAGRRPRLRDRPGRLGPGRIHHCMRLIGLAERALELMCKRASARRLRQAVAQQTVTQERIAEARCKIDMARLLTLKAAWMMDVAGNKVAKTEIAMIKVVAPSMACQVIDWAIQAHGGGGMCDDFPLAFPTPRRARCALPTARTKCTATRSPSGTGQVRATQGALSKHRAHPAVGRPQLKGTRQCASWPSNCY